MPDYLAPCVFVEEVSFRAQAIDGVGTTLTGFIGPCRWGPVTGVPEVLSSLADFERRYGDGQPLALGADGAQAAPNYLWHAARSFFEEGGQQLCVSRVYRPRAGTYPSSLAAPFGAAPHDDGHGRVLMGLPPHQFRIVARHPGAMGHLQLRFGVKLAPPGDALASLAEGDLVWVSSARMPPPAPVTGDTLPVLARNLEDLPLCVARRDPAAGWRFTRGAASLSLADLTLAPGGGDELRRLSLRVEVSCADGRLLGAWDGLANDLFDRFSLDGPGRAALPLVMLDGCEAGVNAVGDGLGVLRALVAQGGAAGLGLGITQAEWDDAGRDEWVALRRKFERGVGVAVHLAGGHDGLLPGPAEYAGRPDTAPGGAAGLQQFEALEDMAIVAAPGSTWRAAERADEVAAITRLLIAHAERMRYRIAVLDSHEGQSITEVRRLRSSLDSRHAALYYPWVTVRDGFTGRPLNLPPSGFVAGIYVRSDMERGVHKAPANELVRSAIGFETPISAAQQELLNPEGINAFRFFEGRGHRLWGARTVSADPEWHYVNLRRYFAYLEHAIDKGTRWAVFEPHGEPLWARVRTAIQDFLTNEWSRGCLLGDKPEKAFFVRCDLSTMTQDDLDHGRLVCLVGVAPLRPAEFVIFRVSQRTSGAA